VSARLAGYVEEGEIRIRLTDDELGIDVGAPLTVEEAREMAASLLVMVGEVEARRAQEVVEGGGVACADALSRLDALAVRLGGQVHAGRSPGVGWVLVLVQDLGPEEHAMGFASNLPAGVLRGLLLETIEKVGTVPQKPGIAFPPRVPS
jgi:hypothetical protein